MTIEFDGNDEWMMFNKKNEAETVKNEHFHFQERKRLNLILLFVK
jgi:hypothetical protein